MLQIGDYVEILISRVPNRGERINPNTIGKITKLQDQREGLNFYVSYPNSGAEVYDGRDGWWFRAKELRLSKAILHPMQDPDFSLDELELAEKIIGDV